MIWPFNRKSEPKTQKRSYKAAQNTRFTTGWETQPTSADYDIRAGLTALRARSRELYQNNDTVKQFIRLAKVNIVGPKGIQVQSRVMMANGKPDDLARAAIEASFKMWGKRGTPDATGQRSWWQLQNDYIQSIAVDGEFLAIEETAGPWGYRIRVLDPELLPVGYNEDIAGGHYIRAGIEYDPSGKIVAYWLGNPKMSASQSSYVNYTQSGYRRWPAENVIHEFLPEFAVQNRGVPWITVGMYRTGMLSGYEEAELVAARVASSSMGFFEQDGDEISTEWTGDEADPDNPGDFTMDAEPGVFRTLPKNMRFNDWTPSRPTSVFSDFIATMQRGFASGVGVSYASLTNDYSGSNYSSLRQSLLVEREIWACLQTWAYESLHDRVYSNWLERAILFGQLTIGGMEPLRPLADYMPRDWQPRRWDWVDPAKEFTAIEKAISLNVRSTPEVIRQLGRDPETVLEEIAAWNEKLKAAGITNEEAIAGVLNTMEDDEDE